MLGENQYNEEQEGMQGVDSDEYWIKQFESGVPVLDLPTDRARPAAKTFNASCVGLTLDHDLTDLLNKNKRGQ